MSDAIVIQQPSDAAAQLLLLFHGAGANAQDMGAFGERLARVFPEALVVSIQAPRPAHASGDAWQWFERSGITDENRIERIAAAMPDFLSRVRHWQSSANLAAQATALIGFSQGAMMALECARTMPAPAARVVAIGGRFAQLPEAAPRDVTFHLFHGKVDAVVPYAHTVLAAERLVAIDGDVTADVVPFVGHEINAEIEALVIERLKGYLPRRHWEEALRAEGARAPGASRD